MLMRDVPNLVHRTFLREINKQIIGLMLIELEEETFSKIPIYTIRSYQHGL